MVTRIERLRREQASRDVVNDAVNDLIEAGDDVEYAARRLLDDELAMSEREQLVVKVRFNCLRLGTMQERGVNRDAAVRFVNSLPAIEREATIEAFNAGIRG